MEQEKLNEILAKHRMWLGGEEDGERADLRRADLDHSAWPLWCGSLEAHVDDRIAIQLLYHTLSVVQHSPYVSEELKRALLTSGNIDAANRFHRVAEVLGVTEGWIIYG